MVDSQKGGKTLEQLYSEEESAFINEFIRTSQETILRPYEKKNRERISEATLLVKDAFDKQWKKVTGNNYFQPVTTIQPLATAYGKNNTSYSDPRSRKYMTEVVFSEIRWQKLRRKIAKRFTDLYNLSGIVNDTGTERPIFQNLTFDRLKYVLGEKDALRLVKAAKENEVGSISGSFNINVEGFWEIQFSPRKDPNDPVDVRLLWEGQCLIMKRMIPVVVPGFYIELADNATRAQYTQTAKKGRQKVGVIQEYPYVVFREATIEEYLAQKEEGDRITREAIAREEG